jgi:hypothetical protein
MLNKKNSKYVLFFAMLSYYAKKEKYDNRIELLLDKKINADILILGSSRANNDYSPEVIMNQTGRTCYNLGMSGTNVVFHEMILDLILMNPDKPKLIIYNIDDYASLHDIKKVVFRKDLLYPYVDNPYINNKICAELNKNELATRISCSYKQNVNFSNALKYLLFGKEKMDYKINNTNAFGATLIVNKPQDAAPVYIANTTDLTKLKTDQTYRQSLINIQKKCSQNNIQLIFCFPPKFISPTPGFFNEIKSNTFKNVAVLDYSEKMSNSDYFFDTEHLNKTGAAFFSQLLSQEIKKLKSF